MADKFDACDKNLIGRRVRWTIWNQTYTGTIIEVITNSQIYAPGDWFVSVDNTNQRAVICGTRSKLIDE